MPLIFPGETAPTMTGNLSIRAKDSDGNPVVVIGSLAAIQDHGLPRVKDVASGKYDNGLFESDGSIFVSVNDFS